MKQEGFADLFLQTSLAVLITFIAVSAYKMNTIENFETRISTSGLFEVPFHIDRISRDSITNLSGVPLSIYQSWHSNMVPEKMKDTIYKLLKVNQEFDYYLYSDENCLNFIIDNFDSEVSNAFQSMKPGAYKSDLWRYCILYVKGGVYLDIKYYSTVPMFDIIEKNPVIFVKDMPGSCGNTIGIYNAFMASPPNNNIFKYCIDDIVNSCKFKLYKRSSLDITGPCLLADVIRKYMSQTYIDNLQFVFGYVVTSLTMAVDRTTIRYKNTIILKVYPEYRNEQKKFQKSEHYGTAWDKRNVYY
jgi:mannosyltransferase OCH1-like enzyme